MTYCATVFYGFGNNTGGKINFATVCRTPLDSPGARIAQGFVIDLGQAGGKFLLVSRRVTEEVGSGTFV
jgi:hypothetical protein